MTSEMVNEPPRYRLFSSTWGSFSGESGFDDLLQTEKSAVALATAFDSLGALEGEPLHIHDYSGPAAMSALNGFLEESEGDAIFYFASHGLVPTGSNQYFRLATGDTRDIGDMAGSFFVAEAIERLSRSGGGRKLLIVDACYSGKAAGSILSRSSLDIDVPPEICMLAATDSFTAARAPEGDPLTAFSGSLAQVLVEGLPTTGPQISVQSIFSHLSSSAELEELPRPTLISTGGSAELITFRNAAGSGGGNDDLGFDEIVSNFEHRTEILYVEDEERFRVQFKEHLEGSGHRVTLAEGPIEAQQALSENYYDIVVIDLLLVDDVPATELIQLCSREAEDSLIFLVSRDSMRSADLWTRLDTIFPFPNRIGAFLWKPDYVRTIEQHANRIRNERRNALSHVKGVDDAVARVAERMIARDPKLGGRSERIKLEVRATIEKLISAWFPMDQEGPVYIESMTVRAVDGGRSSSAVFTLVPTLRGIEPESVTPLVLKLGARLEIEEEIRSYDRYVQVGVPLDFRTDKINSALTGNVGGVIYSFRGGDDNLIREVSQLTFAEVEQCLETVFGRQSKKRWTASHGTGDGMLPTDHFARLNYPPARFLSTYRQLRESHSKNLSGIESESELHTEAIEPAVEGMSSKHSATLVHGDLTLDNLVQINDSRYVIIDYRTVGLGPRLVDFATLEVSCWLLARSSDSTRSERFEDATRTVPREFQPTALTDTPDWLQEPLRLATRCRELALENHGDATSAEYGTLLWLAAVRCSEFNSRATSTAQRNAERALLPAIAIAAQSLIDA